MLEQFYPQDEGERIHKLVSKGGHAPPKRFKAKGTTAWMQEVRAHGRAKVE